MGVCDSSQIYLQDKKISKDNKKDIYKVIPPNQTFIYEKKSFKTPLNSSKSNQKDNKNKNNFYSITEINNYKMPTKKFSPKINNVNYSFEKNQLMSQNTNSRNISFLKEEIQSKKKLNKKIPIYKELSNNNKKKKDYSSNAKKTNSKYNSELDYKQKGLKFKEKNCSSKKSISPKKIINEHLNNNISFNEISFYNNINSISFNINKSCIKGSIKTNKNMLVSQKSKKLGKTKKSEPQSNNTSNNKNTNNIKKIKPNSEVNAISSFNISNKDKNINFNKNNYNNYNSYDSDIGMKKKLFSLNNSYSFYNKYSLYIIDDETINHNVPPKKYSNEEDFIKILNQKVDSENKIIEDLLKLEQRNWYNELIKNSTAISKYRNQIDRFFNQIIEKFILIYEHFNWIIYSLSAYFTNIFYKTDNIEKELLFSDGSNIYGLDNKINSWLNGFKWKGLYIRVISYEKARTLINEIKALNYYFFDYLQIIDINQNIKKNNHMKKIPLSNNIIFPLIGYSKINNYILYVSALITPDKSNNDKSTGSTYITTNELIEQNNKILNYYSNINENPISSTCSFETNVSFSEISNNMMINKIKKTKIYMSLSQNKNILNEFIDLDFESSLGNNFYINDLLQSKLFKEINNYNLIKIKGGKFIIFNLAKFIPKLFHIKFKYSQKLNFYSEFNKDKKYFTLYQNLSTNKNMFKSQYKYIKTPEDVMDKIYNMKNTFASPLNYKDVYFNNIYFRIIYEKTEKAKKDVKTKNFVDHLFTFNTKSNVDIIFNKFNSNNIGSNSNNNSNNSSKNNLSNMNNYSEERNYITGKYVILYDLIEPIKLDYSIIKNHKWKNDSDSLYNIFYFKSNYFTFFNSWCAMLNKNNYNIKTYSDLKYYMKKYSINTNLLFFSLIYIKNEEIVDIIKIHLLIKIMHKIFINENINLKHRIILSIILYIKSILYPHELRLESERKEFCVFYSKIIFFATVLFLKYKLIDDYMNLGLLNIKLEKNNTGKLNNHNKKMTQIIPGFDSPKEFIKQTILVARKKPFLFLSELETKLNIIINPYIKFKSSLSLESMKGEIKRKIITFNKVQIFSFINPVEISGLIFVKIISCFKPSDEKEINSQFTTDSYNDSNDETNISLNKNNIEIKHNNKSKSKKMIKEFNDKKNNNSNNHSNKDKKDNFTNEGDLDEFNQDYNKRKKMSKIQLTTVNLSIKKKRLTSPTTEKKKSEINIISWDDFCNRINISLPPICHKLIFSYEEKLNSNEKTKNGISNYLKYKYTLVDSQILEHWKKCNLNLFQKVRSCNGQAEFALLKSYVYLFIYYYFIDKKITKAREIIKEIKSIYKNVFSKLSFNELSIIYLLEGLCCENFMDSEKFLSICMMFFLMNYGDPRGRNNDSSGVIQYPLWILTRKVLVLKETISYEYFKEMYQTLDYFEAKKNHAFISYNNANNKINFNYSDNIQNNIENILFLNNINKKNENNNIANYSFNYNVVNCNQKKIVGEIDKNRSFIYLNTPLNSLIDKDLFLSDSIFNSLFLEKDKISTYYFPSISIKSNEVIDEFYKLNFIVYIFKQIQSLLLNRHLVYDKEYIKENISDEILSFEDDSQEVECFSSDNLTSIDSKKKIEEIPDKIFKKSNNSSFETKSKNKDSSSENNIKIDSGNNFNSNSTKNNNINNKKKKGNVLSHFLNDELFDKLSYKKNIPSGVIISFGNNPHNETSHDKYKMLALPRIIFKLKNTIIDHIYSGWEHNIVLSNKGEIFSFGYNQSYQCGLDNSNLICRYCINDPTNISVIHNLYAKSISCGNEHSLILSKNKEVYGIGSNEDGVLGCKDIKLKSYKPILIHFGEKDEYTKRIKQISCGTVHNLALTDDGKIFSWGAAQGGQLGHDEEFLLKSSGGNKYYYVSHPAPISTFIDMKININKISCGEAHSVALSTTGSAYSWGFGSNGQLGLGFCEDCFELGKGLAKSRRFLPEKININGIKNIQCGKTFTLFINKENKLLGCGNNDLNQLGFNFDKNNEKRNCHDLIYPTIIDSFSTFEVKKIACGEGHCLAIIKDASFSGLQSLWSWGNNKFGQLGQGSTSKIGLPKPMNLLMDYGSDKKGIEEISCGGFHSLCLVKYKESINWLYNDFDERIVKVIDEIGIN